VCVRLKLRQNGRTSAGETPLVAWRRLVCGASAACSAHNAPIADQAVRKWRA
jgi:hypothetical protein